MEVGVTGFLSLLCLRLARPNLVVAYNGPVLSGVQQSGLVAYNSQERLRHRATIDARKDFEALSRKGQTQAMPN